MASSTLRARSASVAARSDTLYRACRTRGSSKHMAARARSFAITARGWTTGLAGRGRSPATECKLRRGFFGLSGSKPHPWPRNLDFSSPVFLALDRVRSEDNGKPISLERSQLPWRPAFATTLREGLAEGSLRRTMEALGLRPAGGTEAVELVHLSASDARQLQGRGEPFLATTPVVHDLSGSILEHVRSLLHPGHFTLRLTFGASRE